MRVLLSLVIVLHGLIHLMGFAKAFGYAELEQLTQPIPKSAGLLWLWCAAAFAAAGVYLVAGRQTWWWLALPALAVSQALIVASWTDAKFGTVANVIVLLAVIPAALAALPDSYPNRYADAAREGLARGGSGELAPVTDADLAHLPDPVQRYLRLAGVVGKPRIRNFRAVFSGEFRSGPDKPWMSFRAQQHGFVEPLGRLFLMDASLYGLPFTALHMFRGEGATMQVKAASLVQVADGRGPEMNRSETVTLFNDLCVMAPAALVDRQRIEWEATGPLAAHARFTHQGNTIAAELSFNAAGELVDFVSDDRSLSSDGRTFTRHRWSTPLRSYRDVGGRRVASHADAVWHLPEGRYIYGKFTIESIDYNVTSFR